MGFYMLFLFFLGLSLSGILFKSVSLFYFLLALCGCFFIFNRKDRLSFDIKGYYWVSLFFFFGLTAVVVGFDWELIFKWRYKAYIVLLFIPLFYILAKKYLLDESVFWKLIIASSVYTFFWVVLVIVEWPVQRDTGLLSDAINRGNMGMLFALFSLVSFFAVQERGWRALASLTFVSGVTLSILSGSRGGWLALLFSLFTISFFLYRYRFVKALREVVILQVVFVFFIIIFWNYLPIESRLYAAMDNVEGYLSGDVSTSVGLRLEAWRISIYAFMEKPWFGWGWTNYNEAQAYIMNGGKTENIRLLGHPHNQFFLFLVETGVLMTAMFLIFILWPMIFALKSLSGMKANGSKDGVFIVVLLLVMVEAVVEFSLTDDTFSQKYFVFVYIFITSCSIAVLDNKKRFANSYG